MVRISANLIFSLPNRNNTGRFLTVFGAALEALLLLWIPINNDYNIPPCCMYVFVMQEIDSGNIYAK